MEEKEIALVDLAKMGGRCGGVVRSREAGAHLATVN